MLLLKNDMSRSFVLMRVNMALGVPNAMAPRIVESVEETIWKLHSYHVPKVLSGCGSTWPWGYPMRWRPE
jgi:hypothetical protein